MSSPTLSWAWPAGTAFPTSSPSPTYTTDRFNTVQSAVPDLHCFADYRMLLALTITACPKRECRLALQPTSKVKRILFTLPTITTAPRVRPHAAPLPVQCAAPWGSNGESDAALFVVAALEKSKRRLIRSRRACGELLVTAFMVARPGPRRRSAVTRRGPISGRREGRLMSLQGLVRSRPPRRGWVLGRPARGVPKPGLTSNFPILAVKPPRRGASRTRPTPLRRTNFLGHKS